MLFYGGAFVECARRIASFRQVFRGIRLGLFNRAYDYARRTRLTNLLQLPVDELWDLPVAEARRRLGMPPGGPAADSMAEIPIPAPTAAALAGSGRVRRAAASAPSAPARGRRGWPDPRRSRRGTARPA